MIKIALGEEETTNVLSLALCLTDGVPCDSFEAELIHSPQLEAAALKAAAVRIYNGSELVFTGVLDEMETRISESGRQLFVAGRSPAALLMRTECASAQFYSASLSDVLARYVTPCGVTNVRADSLPAVPHFSVTAGTNCWSVLRNFAGWSAGVVPRFAADGALVLLSKESGIAHEITPALPVISASARRLFCALPGSAAATERTSGKTIVYSDAELTAAGFTGKVTLTAPNGTLSAYRARAEWAVKEKKRDWVTAEVTLMYPFAAAPLDAVTLSLGEGLSGTFFVAEAKTVVGISGARTTLKLIKI